MGNFDRIPLWGAENERQSSINVRVFASPSKWPQLSLILNWGLTGSTNRARKHAGSTNRARKYRISEAGTPATRPQSTHHRHPAAAPCIGISTHNAPCSGVAARGGAWLRLATRGPWCGPDCCNECVMYDLD